MKLSPAEFVIFRFGGVRKTARALNKTPSTVSKWQHQNNGQIPSSNMLTILELADEKDLDINAEDLVHGREVSRSEYMDQ